MYELTIQLLIIMFGKQAFNNILELFIPWAMNKWRLVQARSEEVIRPLGQRHASLQGLVKSRRTKLSAADVIIRSAKAWGFLEKLTLGHPIS